VDLGQAGAGGAGQQGKHQDGGAVLHVVLLGLVCVDGACRMWRKNEGRYESRYKSNR
jgi:hypothetical protein